MPAFPEKSPEGDITPEERVQALEKELEVAENILRGIKDGVIYLDREGRVGRISPAMENILGVADRDARGRRIEEVCQEKELCPLLTGAYGGPVLLNGREYEVENTELKGKDGRRLGISSLLRDVTEKHRLDRQRADFLSMITHDLKSPLTTVLGYTSLLLEGAMGELNPDAKEAVDAIDRSGRKLVSLIDDLLTLSRLDAETLEPVRVPVRLDRLAEGVIASFWPEASKSGKLLELVSEPDLPQVSGDVTQMERVISNLLDNAVKFTGEQGLIRVTLSRKEEAEVAARLGARPETPGPYVELKVKDTGIGIPAEELPHLFDRYWRGKRSGDIRGTGLGLAIVKCVAEAHGGSMKAESVEGEGSTFYVWLPVRR